MNQDEAIKQIYTKTDQLGYKFLCKTHTRLDNKDEYMKIHLFQEHSISLPFEFWQVWFTLFSVGDSYSNSYRCKICNNEYLLESEAKKHIISHGIKLESLHNKPKKLVMDFFNGLDTEKVIQVFDENKKCEECGHVGSYVIQNDPIVGICYEHLQNQYTNIEETIK